MAFMLGYHLVFLDSFQFMSSSLDNLVKNLPEKSFKYTKEEFQDTKLELMKQNGIYPYDFIDSFDKFEQKELPKKDDIFSQLTNEHISDKNYRHAQNVWNKFKFKIWVNIMICI